MMVTQLAKVDWCSETDLADHAQRMYESCEPEEDIAFQDLFWAVVKGDYGRVMAVLNGHINDNIPQPSLKPEFPDYLKNQITAPFGCRDLPVVAASNQNNNYS
ncbi:hypothetical protein ACR9YC_12705 [Parasphingorhabdus sp. DH2-15]|uniref:hypothetical protein n=1 Tax=Parasphingorhabdus sp. DH2-15 TaxID=3444112 RepID=UPI003F684E84